jgi:hypothetical protein
MRCPVCNGNGHRNGNILHDEDCLQCNGSGEVCLECGESAPNGHDFCERHRPQMSKRFSEMHLEHPVEWKVLACEMGFDVRGKIGRSYYYLGCHGDRLYTDPDQAASFDSEDEAKAAIKEFLTPG